MNLRIALTQSHELADDPRAFAGKLLADHRQITETLRAMLESDAAFVLGFDTDEWEIEANDLSDLWEQMFKRFRA